MSFLFAIGFAVLGSQLIVLWLVIRVCSLTRTVIAVNKLATANTKALEQIAKTESARNQIVNQFLQGLTK